MKKESIFKVILAVVVVISSCKQNQNSFQNATKKGFPVIKFECDSVRLTSAAENRLNYYTQYVSSAIEGQCLIVLSSISTKEELSISPNIGLMRAKSIIDFYERIYSINRDNFLIHCSDELDRKNSYVIMSFDFCITNSEN